MATQAADFLRATIRGQIVVSTLHCATEFDRNLDLASFSSHKGRERCHKQSIRPPRAFASRNTELKLTSC